MTVPVYRRDLFLTRFINSNLGKANFLKKLLRICSVINVEPFLHPIKRTGTIALTIHIHFVKPAKMNASVDHQLENAQVQSFTKFWRSCLGFVPITRLDVAKKFGKLKTLMIIKKIAFFVWFIVQKMSIHA